MQSYPHENNGRNSDDAQWVNSGMNTITHRLGTHALGHLAARGWLAAMTLALGAAVAAGQAQPGAEDEHQTSAPANKEAVVDTHADDATAVLGFTMKTIDGESQLLEEHYAGKVVLMVNVASRCGLTPQYEGLEALFERYKDRGLVILGFPANNFGGQEPGTDKEIKAFCTDKYEVSFPMFSKISVLPKDQHPLYTKLAKAMKAQGGAPSWNFTKYLIDRSGHVQQRFDPRTKPDDPKLIQAVESMLDAPVPNNVRQPAEAQATPKPATTGHADSEEADGDA